jgi:hypothetical protein
LQSDEIYGLAPLNVPVAVQDDAEKLAGGCDADALLVAQLVKSALHTKHTLPILTICSATGHCAQQIWRDWDALLHGLRGNVAAHARAAVDGNDNSALEHKAESGSAVKEFDVGFAFAILERGGQKPEWEC